MMSLAKLFSISGDGSWGSNVGQMKAPPPTRGAKGQYRSHPYGGRGGGY